MSDAYRATPPSETALQWARWKRLAVMAVAFGVSVGAIFFGVNAAMLRRDRIEAEIERARPCLDVLQTGTGVHSCAHRDHSLEVVTYSHEGAVLCRCRTTAAAKADGGVP